MTDHRPRCTCALEKSALFETSCYRAAVRTMLSAVVCRQAENLCDESEGYLSLLLITMLAVGMSCDYPVTIENMGKIREEKFDAVLASLAEDVRRTRAEIETFTSSMGETRQ